MRSRWLRFYRENGKYRTEVLERLNREQREYWSVPGRRRVHAERSRRYFAEHPAAREKFSEQAKRNGATRRFERGARKPRDNSGELLTTAVVIRKVCIAGGRHILGTLRNSPWRPSEPGQTPRRDAGLNTA